MKIKETFHQRINRHGQQGVSLIETMVASVIAIISITGAYSYIDMTMLHAKKWKAVSASDDLHSTFRSVIRSVIEAEGKTDPCLKSHKLSNELSKRHGEITKQLKLSRFDPSKVESQKKLLGNDYDTWKQASSFCSTSSGSQRACIFIEASAKENSSIKHLALGIISQSTYDFSSLQPVSSASCNNENILENNRSDGAGVGIKANYILMTATITTSGNDFKVTSKRIPGEVSFTLPKLVKTGSPSGFDTSNTYSCHFDFCKSIAPDPGVNYQAWQNFPAKSAAYQASFCDKCERSPIFK